MVSRLPKTTNGRRIFTLDSTFQNDNLIGSPFLQDQMTNSRAVTTDESTSYSIRLNDTLNQVMLKRNLHADSQINGNLYLATPDFSYITISPNYQQVFVWDNATYIEVYHPSNFNLITTITPSQPTTVPNPNIAFTNDSTLAAI